MRYKKSVRVKYLFEQIMGYNVIEKYFWTGKPGLNTNGNTIYCQTVKRLFGKKKRIPPCYVHAISCKMLVKSLNCCQTIVRRKRRIFSNILLPDLEIGQTFHNQ
jgi:hypothetical protein